VGGQYSESYVSEVVDSVVILTTDYMLGNEVTAGLALLKHDLFD
jgi:hypothetical protein